METGDRQTSNVEVLLAQMKESRGYLPSSHEFLAREDPEFLIAWNEMVGKALLHDGGEGAELGIKYRELIVACMLALLRVPVESVAAHLRRGMRFGLTKREVIEGFQAACVPGGAPVLVQGMRALLQLEEEDRTNDSPG